MGGEKKKEERGPGGSLSLFFFKGFKDFKDIKVLKTGVGLFWCAK